jgi:hypothetical protein
MAQETIGQPVAGAEEETETKVSQAAAGYSGQ